MMKPLYMLLLMSVFVSMLGGCAVTTKSLELDDVQKRISMDRDLLYKKQEPLKEPITMEVAMSRSIKYNVDHRLKLLETAISLRQLDLMTYDMLPRLVANAGYTSRDSYNASDSLGVKPASGRTGLYTTSHEKNHTSGDLTIVWNVLDFGVSYFQAKQQSDRSHIMKERRRKVVHSIMQQVRQQYWLALGAQQLEARFAAHLKEVEQALKDATRIEQEKLRPPLESLNYRKTLLEIIRQLEIFRDEMAQAKPQLAALMNYPIGQPFSLVSPESLPMLKGPDPLQYLEIRALLQRPELMEADYNERISLDETRKAIVRMLPGIELYYGGHSDSNTFLLNKQWLEGGVKLTWNLMNLFSGSEQYKLTLSQTELAQVQRLALNVAVLSQVHVAYQNFFSRKRQFELAEQLQDIDSTISGHVKNQAASGTEYRLSVIRSETAALMSEYRSYQNYASWQGACGQIVASLGDDPLPEVIVSHEIKDLSAEIAARLYSPGALCSPIPRAVAVVEKVIAPAVSLDAMPGSIAIGQKSRLSWQAKNAVKCDIQPGIGVVPPQGEREVSPSGSTIYTAVCDGEGGTANASARVDVIKPKAVRQIGPMILALEFETAKWDIVPEHHETLRKLAEFIKECPGVTGEISGHTDNVRYQNPNMDNTKLSHNRANSIRNYLITHLGIDPKRLTAKGYGPSMPIASNDTAEGRSKNRRIEANFRCDEI